MFAPPHLHSHPHPHPLPDYSVLYSHQYDLKSRNWNVSNWKVDISTIGTYYKRTHMQCTTEKQPGVLVSWKILQSLQ